MPDTHALEIDQSTRQRHAEREASQFDSSGLRTESPLLPVSLWREAASRGGRGNSPARAAAMQSMQQTHGNRAVQRAVEQPPRPVQRAPESGSYSASQPLPFSGMPFALPDLRDLLGLGKAFEGGGFGFGSEPSAEGEPAGPYGYAKVNEHGGQEVGFSTWHEEIAPGGIPVEYDWGLFGVDKQGTFETSEDNTRTGILRKFGLGGFQAKVNEGGYVSGDVEALTAAVDATVGSDGATLSMGATALGGSVTMGEANAESNTDEIRRLGFSAGPSAALRTHWADEDSDGYREYGLGADIGALSMDYKTEDPVRAAMRTALYSNPFTAGPGAALDYATSDMNVTDKAADAASAVGSGISDAWDYVWD